MAARARLRHAGDMGRDVGLIGFGEAGSTFATAGAWRARAQVYDIKSDSPIERDAIHAAYAAAGVHPARVLAGALDGVPLIMSLVTADQALHVAEAAAALIRPGTVYCDLNSVAPQTKRAAAGAVEAAGGHYVDVAVMAPVNPLRLAVPLLLSGARATDAEDRLAALGFTNMRIIGDTVGRASAIKMIRSVMVKGMEALTAECLFAAEAAGVRDEVLASLGPDGRAERADYNLDRMLVHGQRRAAEMQEVVKTLEALGVQPVMSRGTVRRQQAIGALGIKAPAQGISAKIRQIHDASEGRADAA